MEETIIQRVKLLLESKYNGNVSAFAKATGTNQVTASDYISGRRKPSLAFVNNILSSHPDISAEWLLRGKVDMYIKPSVIERIFNKLPYCDDAEYYEKELEKKDRQIRQLSLENNRYSKLFESLEQNKDIEKFRP